jgi:hypothetical protein
MKIFIYTILLGWLLPGAHTTYAQDLSRYDLSTDEGVNAAREALRGEALDAESQRCIRRATELPRIVVVGDFAYDLGCRSQGVFVASRYFKITDLSLSKAALDALGWNASNPEERKRLARLWVEKGLLAFSSVMVTKDSDFGNSPFHPPQAMADKDGVITVSLWVRMPSGMRPGPGRHEYVEYKFSRDGDLMAPPKPNN